jgi:inhibitor of cysteine peptidase
MKLKWLFIGVMAAALLVMTACSRAVSQASVNESDSGKQVEIWANGGILTVTLESNQTTGYGWELKEISDPSVLQKTESEYETPVSGLVGAGSKEVWTFKALNAGTTTLSMEYSQPWEGGQKGAKSFTITVVVKYLTK